MRRALGLLALILCFICVKAQNKFVVEGKINKYEGKVYLNFGNERDSLYSKTGRFRFIGEIGLPVNASVQVSSKEDKMSVTNFWIDEGKTILELDTASFNNERFSGLDVRGKILEAGKTHKFVDSMIKKFDKIYSQSASQEEKNTATRIIIDSLLLIYPNNILSIYFLNSHLDLFTEKELLTIYNGWDLSFRKSQYGLAIKNRYLKKVDVQIGNKIPDFAQQNQFGRLVSISDFKGKYLLIDFWASWCIPCRKENPNLVNVYKKYKSKGFDVLAVSLDFNKQSWLKAIKTDNLEWNHVSDLGGWENEVSRMLNVRSIPSNILVDHKGIVISKNLQGEALQRKLAELFE